MYPHMYKIPLQIRFQSVHHYLNTKDTLISTAKKFNIHYQTLFKWVKRYNTQPEEDFFSTYKRPWNRAANVIEKKVIDLKEKNPLITVREIRKKLAEDDIQLSLNGIWCIWNRYGYAGFNRVNIGNDFTEYGRWSREAQCKLEQAKKMKELGKIKASASILNSIPFLPKNSFLPTIPDEFLSLNRKIEKHHASFGKISLSAFSSLSHALYEECRQNKLGYSVLRTRFLKLIALQWRGKAHEVIREIKQMRRLFDKKTSLRNSCLFFSIRFSLLIAEGLASVELSRIKKGFEIARKCQVLITRRRHESFNLMADLAVLYITLEDYNQAEKLMHSAIDHVDQAKRKRLRSQIAIYVHFLRNEQRAARQLLKDAEVYEWVRRAWQLRFRSLFTLFKGMPLKAISLATQALNQSKKDEIDSGIVNSYFAIATAYRSIGEKKKSRQMLRQLLPILKKNKLRRYATVAQILLGKKIAVREDLRLSTIKLAWLLRNDSYQRALSFAKAKGILIYFYRYLFFFPDTIRTRIEKGKKLGLPKAILKLPVFSKQCVTFNIRFLGPMVIIRNQKRLKVKLQPKEKAFLIHCALRFPEPGGKIDLSNIYTNFWSGSRNPSENLSHLLVTIKKACQIPSHLIEIESARKQFLLNRGIYFASDYNEYQQTLIRGKALEIADMWDLSRKEYIRAFKLFRGKPFRKMYDPWSEEINQVIQNQMEKTIEEFISLCAKYNDQKTREKIKTSLFSRIL